MASFEYRSGAWRARIIRRPLGIDESATFPTKSQASAWATKREAEILAGARGLPTGHTVGDAIDRFIRDVCPGRKGARWDELRLLKFKRDAPKLALRPLSKVTSDDMAQWRDSRLQDVSPSSVAREMNLWGALFSIAVREWRWATNNPCNGVKRPLEPAARRRGIAANESAAIIANLNGVAGLQVKNAFLLSLETAMRAGEILGLTWDHVDLQNRVVTLPVTKNGDSRQVPLSNAAVAILVGLKPEKHDRAKDNVPVVFTITGATLDVLFRRARDKAIADCPSCADIHFHDARGQAIRNFVAKGLGVYEICSIVGHRDPKSIMFYFRHSAAEIAKKLD